MTLPRALFTAIGTLNSTFYGSAVLLPIPVNDNWFGVYGLLNGQASYFLEMIFLCNSITQLKDAVMTPWW
jgi:hypothetical protein